MKRPHRFAPRSCISLRHFQRNQIGAMARHVGRRVLIWSDEHRAWWRPDGKGYCEDRRGAGVYDLTDAWRCTSHCGPEKRIWFVWADRAEGDLLVDLRRKVTPHLFDILPHRLAQMLRDGARAQVPRPDNLDQVDFDADAAFIVELLRADRRTFPA